ncbi:hypothetical protein [Streptomyces sp. HNM0574]|uniref:hypothetical protein n=1 Tax=Streptomyces sp. HNM0574 TaxID=2714954 RepID=UPI00146E8271|nr:hypothetical protein [Streptomyces sp. HNM0574]NLU69004.1 hypothetical protein [Streptomyces sp. HNM0574]
MTPPPPPLTFRRRGERPRCDPALDDAPLTTARTALAQGRWREVRSLLLDTGDDWDRRGHRLLTLAGLSAAEAWARDWRLTEPDSGDARVLHACAAAWRAARRLHPSEEAHGLLAEAARQVPDDPTPWVARLLLARRTGDLPACAHAFAEVRARHPDHHHAHHLMTAAEAEQGARVYEFAEGVADRVPADSPLTQLPVVAHAERFRVLVAAGQAHPDPATACHWRGRRAEHIVRGAFDWWLEWGAEDGHPRRLVDLNFLAHAKLHEGRTAEAAALFQRIGTHVTPGPWSYSGHDPERTFRAARRLVLGT